MNDDGIPYCSLWVMLSSIKWINAMDSFCQVTSRNYWLQFIFFLQLVNCSREQRLVQQVKGDKNDDNDDSKEEERTQYHHS